MDEKHIKNINKTSLTSSKSLNICSAEVIGRLDLQSPIKSSKHCAIVSSTQHTTVKGEMHVNLKMQKSGTCCDARHAVSIIGMVFTNLVLPKSRRDPSEFMSSTKNVTLWSQIPCTNEFIDAIGEARTFSMWDDNTRNWQTEIDKHNRHERHCCHITYCANLHKSRLAWGTHRIHFIALWDVILPTVRWLFSLIHLDDT